MKRILLQSLKIRIRIEKKCITSETNNFPTNLLQNSSNLNYLLLNVFRFTPVINLILRIIFVYSFTPNFLILLFPTFCNKWILSLTIFCFQVLGLFSSFGFVSNIPHTHTTMLNARPTIFSFGVLGLLSSFSFFKLIPLDVLRKN